ncbi:Holliday junction resolvase RuvX, partial [Patescibacteria group bacterium]|nr:Holliday junction resolvase RuvX [Patescibacteria group bacterium]
MGRILAIDYGEKRIGLAISDEEQKFSFELDIWSPREFSENIRALLAERNIEKIVLGHPLGMSGQKTAKTAEVERFKEELEKMAQVPVELFD